MELSSGLDHHISSVVMNILEVDGTDLNNGLWLDDTPSLGNGILELLSCANTSSSEENREIIHA